MKRINTKIILVLAGLLAVGFFLLPRGGDASGSDARALVEKGARLVDVRAPEEFASGHVPGAVNIPVQDLAQRMGEVGPKDGPVVVYCKSGNRSGRAASLLKEAGFTAIHDLGAMSRW
jgi:rhodanese-related sulfurtransferase